MNAWDLVLLIYAHPIVRAVLGLLVANVLVGIAAAIKAREFRLAMLGDWLLNRAMALASRNVLVRRSAALLHVAHVLSLRARDQVSRRAIATVTHAGRSVAFMASPFTWGQRPTKSHLKGNLVNRAYGSVPVDLSVAIGAETSSPQPARSKFGSMGRGRAVLIDVSPESFFWSQQSPPARAGSILLVTGEEAEGKPLDPALTTVGTTGDLCGLTAAACTEAKWRKGRLLLHLDLLYRGAIGAGRWNGRAPSLYPFC